MTDQIWTEKGDYFWLRLALCENMLSAEDEWLTLGLWSTPSFESEIQSRRLKVWQKKISATVDSDGSNSFQLRHLAACKKVLKECRLGRSFIRKAVERTPYWNKRCFWYWMCDISPKQLVSGCFEAKVLLLSAVIPPEGDAQTEGASGWLASSHIL